MKFFSSWWCMYCATVKQQIYNNTGKIQYTYKNICKKILAAHSIVCVMRDRTKNKTSHNFTFSLQNDETEISKLNTIKMNT